MSIKEIVQKIINKINGKTYLEIGVNRKEIVQKIINKINGKTYLEIGVADGSTFEIINAKNKIGVDPCPAVEKVVKVLNQDVKYFEMTSDEFFQKKADEVFGRNGIDVVLIDGLHEYKQVLRDVKNCLKYLNNNGVIVMHDCNPWSATVALPATSIKAASEEAKRQNLEWTGAWTGDVWKSIVNFRSLKDNINVFTLNCDCGLGIITKGEPENSLDYSTEDIEKMEYETLDKNREKFLNLKNVEYFSTFLEKVSAD